MKVFSNIMTWIDKLSGLAKALIVIFSFLGGAAGGISAYNHWIIDNEYKKVEITQQAEEFKEMQGSFTTVIDSLSILSREIRSIKPHIDKMDSRIDELINSNTNLRGYLINRAVDKDEVLQIIRIWDEDEKKKKNSD